MICAGRRTAKANLPMLRIRIIAMTVTATLIANWAASTQEGGAGVVDKPTQDAFLPVCGERRGQRVER